MVLQVKPFLLGALMGLMMLGMMHMLLTGQSDLAGWALVGFVGAHVFVIAMAMVGTVFAARLSPSVRERLSRLHRPSGRHVLLMFAGAGGTALIIHLFLHGGV